MSDTLAPDVLYLWRALRHYIEQTCLLFGMPNMLAQKLFLTRTEHARICAWLRPLEHLLRRLIFLEALKLTPEPLSPSNTKAAPSASCLPPSARISIPTIPKPGAPISSQSGPPASHRQAQVWPAKRRRSEQRPDHQCRLFRACRVAAAPGYHSVIQAIRLVRATLLDKPAPDSS